VLKVPPIQGRQAFIESAERGGQKLFSNESIHHPNTRCRPRVPGQERPSNSRRMPSFLRSRSQLYDEKIAGEKKRIEDVNPISARRSPKSTRHCEVTRHTNSGENPSGQRSVYRGVSPDLLLHEGGGGMKIELQTSSNGSAPGSGEPCSLDIQDGECSPSWAFGLRQDHHSAPDRRFHRRDPGPHPFRRQGDDGQAPL